MRLSHTYLILLTLLFSSLSFSAKKNKAFEALRIYDYFKAKKLFQEQLRKKDPAAFYGLSLIYYRNDNPFHQLDSALKYCSMGFNLKGNSSTSFTYSGFEVNTTSFQQLIDSIATKILNHIHSDPTITKYNHFLSTAYLCNKNLLNEAFQERDELEYSSALSFNNSDSTYAFILTHPQSSQIKEAKNQYDRQLYYEMTGGRSINEHFVFLQKYPANIMINTSFETLFELCRKNSDTLSLKKYIRLFPNSPYYNEAWKLLFSLSVKSFNNKELEFFLNENPEFPFKNSILKELELNKLELYPYENNDLFGYVDMKGNLMIPCEYESVSEFNEGLASVSRNDSVFFINKENSIAFESFYEEAYSFNNGLAPVKIKNRWHLINRQGQIVNSYDEINELSDDVYVIRLKEKYGALDAYGNVIFEAQFDKLGDFKNGMAYYSTEGKFGFVTKQATVFKAEYDWISDFGANEIAIIKQGNSYGLINAASKKILDVSYDQIIKCPNNIYLLIKNNFYGYYHSSGCFLSSVSYDYLKDKSVDYYTNGTWLKRIHKNEVSIADLNGKTLIEKGEYEEINFISCGLIRVKKKNKFGFLDKKQNLVIPFKFTSAGDFTDSLAIATNKENYVLINVQGNEVFKSEEKIERLNSGHYLTDDENKVLLNPKGKILFTEVKQVQLYNNRLLIITLNSGQIKILQVG